MLRLSKKSDYALMAMKHLAIDSGCRHASARSIAQCYGIPPELMAKILQKLARKGLLQSQHGIRGGYELARKPSSISVLDVIQAIDGPFSLTACSATDRRCAQFRSCSVRDPLWQIRERIVQALRTFSIFDLATETIFPRMTATRASQK
jgi:FeS assembly SUF system regulator